jgi:outer membrane protein assembly factor BamB
MSQDIVTRLRLQLREAAERDERRGALAHALRDTRRWLFSPALAGACAVLVLAVALMAGALLLRGDDTRTAGPAVVAELQLTNNPEGMLPAFGSLWIADPVAGEVVRVDPARRRVIALIAVGSGLRVLMAPVGSELWIAAAAGDTLVRIDAATNAVSGRVPLRTPAGKPFVALDMLAGDGVVWAVSSEGALRLDPRTGAALRLAAQPSASGEPRSFALAEGALWELRSDGALLRRDPATGAVRARVRPDLANAEFIAGAGRDLVALAGATLARLDGDTGRVVWRRTLGQRINAFDLGSGDGLVWAHYSKQGTRDRLASLAFATGAPVTSTPLDSFGGTGVVSLGREIWVGTPAGKTLVVSR